MGNAKGSKEQVDQPTDKSRYIFAEALLTEKLPLRIFVSSTFASCLGSPRRPISRRVLALQLQWRA
jgi:hypothetical protein